MSQYPGHPDGPGTGRPGTGRRRGRIRLTRRGRVVVLGLSLLLAALVTAGVLVTAIAPPASQAADPAPAGVDSGPPVAVVRPGDTLWSVAARHRPSRDPYSMIEEIRRLNDLPDHTIHPGQELILPGRR